MKLDKIERRGRDWVVLSSDGKKVLGKHKTRAEAVRQLRAVEAAKARKMDELVQALRDAEAHGESAEVIRVDYCGPIHTDPERTDGVRATRTREGFLRADAAITRAGVFTYADAEGNTWGEFRDPSEVFDADALASFRMAVVTDDHPDEMVTADTVATVQVGHLGSDVRADGDHVVASILITDADTIAKIDAGKAELSCGYTAQVIRDAGVAPDGTPYQARQTRIRGNHVAIVDRGRAGPTCRIRIDGAAYQIGDTMEDDDKTTDAGTEPKADTTTEPAPSPEPKADTTPEPAPSPEPKADTTPEPPAAYAARIDALEAEIRQLRDTEAERIDQRVELIATAREILGAKFDAKGKTDTDVRRAVIREVSPGLAEKADKGSEDYVRAAYDAAVELHSRRKDTADQVGVVVFDALANGGDDDLDQIYDSFRAAKVAPKTEG